MDVRSWVQKTNPKLDLERFRPNLNFYEGSEHHSVNTFRKLCLLNCRDVRIKFLFFIPKPVHDSTLCNFHANVDNFQTITNSTAYRLHINRRAKYTFLVTCWWRDQCGPTSTGSLSDPFRGSGKQGICKNDNLLGNRCCC